jgi:AraC family ethanolamine operon transcriptional activator
MGARQETAGRSGDDGGDRSAALGMVGIQETYDPCHWERVSQPWEVMATPLCAGPFHNRKTFLATPNCILYHESFGSRMRVHTLSPQGMLCCAVQVRSGDHTSYFSRPLHERGLPIMLPGAAEAVLDAGQEHIMILLRQSLLRRYLDIEQVATLESAAATHLLPACNKTVTHLRAWLTELLRRTHKAPEMLRHPAAVESVERELVAGLADALQLRKPRRAPRLSLRQRGFDRAIDYIRQADLAALDPAALCAAAAVSPRTLEYAFQKSLGLSPAVFIRRLRLHALRRELLASALGESTVTDLAYHLGFTQLGRLAGDYRRTFGELPSATLARPYQGDAPLFWTGRPALGPRAPGALA